MLRTNAKLMQHPLEITYRPPRRNDGAKVWQLIKSSGQLDTNSRYCNLLQCDHFSDTCMVAERKEDGALIGWVSGYRLPDASDTLFIWQIAIDSSVHNRGIGKQLLTSLLQRDSCAKVSTLKTTITSDNKASWALFSSLTRQHKGNLSHTPYFLEDAHFDSSHATEHLVTIDLAACKVPDAPSRVTALPARGKDGTKAASSPPTPLVTIDKQVFARRESEARSYCRSFPAVFAKAQGAVLTDSAGRQYIDFLAGCSTLNYGHNDADMKAALIEHITRDGVTHGLDMHTDAKASFLQTFERVILQPRGMDYRLMFTGPTGTNAVEAALKIARKVTGRQDVVAFTNGFHGVTLGALAATGNEYHRGGAGVPLNNVTRMPYAGAVGTTDTADLLDHMLSDPSSGVEKPAAILLETVQGEGGLNVASPAWLQRIASIARAHGALLIIDDIQAGCGRTGNFFSFDEIAIEPDLITMAKSLSGYGLPLATVLIKPEHDVFGPAEHNGTFRGNTHAFVTARVALEKFWATNTFTTTIAEHSAYLTRRLAAMAALLPNARLKGRSMMQGIDVGSGDLASDICQQCFREGLIIETSGAHGEVVKVLAPLTIEHSVFARGLDILQAAIAAAADTIHAPLEEHA
jgi:diaminobutyrate-2-oxoglutarate transaminase